MQDQETRIRKATLIDQNQLLKLVKLMYLKPSPGYVDFWIENYPRLIKTTYVLEKESLIIGFISYTLKKNAVYIGDLYVLPKFRRLGYGTRLLKLVEEIKDLKHRKYLILSNRKEDIPANKLYLKYGFIIKKEKNPNSWILTK